MSDSTTLIPVLNELMEEYTNLENETEQGSYEAVMQVEDREYENKKQQQKGEESRKRKMGVDEAKTEQMKEREKSFISKKSSNSNGRKFERQRLHCRNRV